MYKIFSYTSILYPIILLCLMLILNSILCLKSIYFFYHFTDCQRIWDVSSPGNHSTCRDFRRNPSLYKNILSPILCSTFDRYRISQSICRHNSGIGSKITRKSNLQFQKVFSKPICKFTLNIHSFRQDQRFSNKIFFFYKLFFCQWIIRPHSNTPVITIRNPDIVQPFRVHRLQE